MKHLQVIEFFLKLVTMQTKSLGKRVASIIFFFFLFQNIYSQENYLAGYIVSFKGDTLHGFIDYRNWEKNPQKISFKEKLTDDKVVFFPTEIKAFSVLDEIYESAIIKTEVSPFKTNDLEYDKELKFEGDTTFLQAVLKGKKSLYTYTNRLGEKQFYIKNGSSYELLAYKRYLNEDHDQTIVFENNKYLGQLSFYLNDCPSVMSKLPTIKYSQQSIENLFLFYNKCTNSGIDFQQKTEKGSMKVSVVAGISITSLKFKSSDNRVFISLVNADMSNSVNVTGGLSFNYVLPRNLKKWSITSKFLYTKFKFSDYVNENSYSTTYVSLGISYIKMLNMARYNYVVGDFTIFCDAGFSLGFVATSTNYKRIESELYGEEIGKALDDVRKYEYGYVVGLGAEFSRYSFEVVRETGTGISEYLMLSSQSTRYYFLLGYRF